MNFLFHKAKCAHPENRARLKEFAPSREFKRSSPGFTDCLDNEFLKTKSLEETLVIFDIYQ